MENKLVRTFIKVVEFNNFTRAAEDLGYSQTAVTAQIKLIEEELGVPLFDRIGRGIRLTQAGETFLPFALDMIEAEEKALASIQQAEMLTGELRIGASSSIASGLLPDVILQFAEVHPGVRIVVRISDYMDDLYDKLAHGEIDFMFSLDEKVPDGKRRLVAAVKEPVLFVTGPGSDLSAQKNVSIEQVMKHSFIIADREVSYCASLERSLAHAGLPLEAAVEIGSIDGIINMLKKDFGISYIPQFMAAPYLNSGELIELPVDLSLPDIYILCYCSKERWLNPIMQEFIKVLAPEQP